MKTNSIFRSLFLLVFAGLLTAGSAIGQTNPKQTFFAEYDKMIDELRKMDAEILSPQFFKKAVEFYNEANEDYDNQESVISIRKKLVEAERFAKRAEEIVKMASLTLNSAIEARSAALDANAPLFSQELWEKAEDRLLESTTNLEDDDIEDARKYGAAALNFFKEAELLAIKNGILGDAREQIALAKEAEAERYCYHTFRNAQNLLAETEEMLNSNRYGKEEAINKATQAAYEGRHAQYLAMKIKQISGEDKNWEMLILEFEDVLRSFGSLFKFDPKFDEGFDPVVKTLMAYISDVKDEKERLQKENSELEEELNLVKEREATTSAELAYKKEQERKVKKVIDIFNQNEAKVVDEGDKLIVRLYGLTFPTGKAIIQPEYFSLLTKVQRAIHEFSDNYIIIEGHTDSQGNAMQNKLLSEERSRAVKEYLQANMELGDDQISHYGMGDQRPIESNKTREGRARNRRIEVIISMDTK